MKQQVLNAIALLAGLASGVVVLPQPLLARFAPAHITWDGSTCPAGEYTITSTARNVVNGQLFLATSGNVRLPAQFVGQDFPDLPGGTYRVTASSVNLEGSVFQSGEQTLTIAGGPPLTPTPTPTPTPATPTPTPSAPLTSTGGHRRPLTSPTEGIALPRPPTDPGGGSQGGNTRGSGEPVVSAPSSAAAGGTRPPQQLITPRLRTAVSMAWVLETLDQLSTVRHFGTTVVQDVELLDEDGDGTIDHVHATIAGRVVIWRISN